MNLKRKQHAISTLVNGSLVPVDFVWKWLRDFPYLSIFFFRWSLSEFLSLIPHWCDLQGRRNIMPNILRAKTRYLYELQNSRVNKARRIQFKKNFSWFWFSWKKRPSQCVNSLAVKISVLVFYTLTNFSKKKHMLAKLTVISPELEDLPR